MYFISLKEFFLKFLYKNIFIIQQNILHNLVAKSRTVSLSKEAICSTRRQHSADHLLIEM